MNAVLPYDLVAIGGSIGLGHDNVTLTMDWLLRTSVQEIGLFCTIEQAFLP